MSFLTAKVTRRAQDALTALHPMPQNDVTLRMPMTRSRETGLRKLLAEINDARGTHPLLPLASLDTLHFARLLILEGPDHPESWDTSLVVLANVDGPVADFLALLVSECPQGLDRIFGACRGYPAARKRTPDSRLSYLREHLIPSQTYYINTVGRTVRQIREEDKLYEALQGFLNDRRYPQTDSPQVIRRAAIEFVQAQPELAPMLRPRPGPGLAWKGVEKLRFVLFAAAGGVVLFWSWPVLAVWLLALRHREQTDLEYTHRAPLSRLNQLRSAEDDAVHNPFAALGFVKPGRLRRLTARGVLFPAQVVLRHVFNNGNLAGIPALGLDGVYTIHFARWTLLDEDRRLLFTSNYDGSLESYMVDFIDKVAWGLNIIFGNGVGYPRTRWLVADGARKEQQFKDYLGLHQLDNQLWYTPYPHLTALQIASNAAVRDGLRGRMNRRQAQAWLDRL